MDPDARIDRWLRQVQAPIRAIIRIAVRRGIAHRNHDEDAHSSWRYQQLDGSLNLTDQASREAHPQGPLGETGQNRQVRVGGPGLVVSGDTHEDACHIYDER